MDRGHHLNELLLKADELRRYPVDLVEYSELDDDFVLVQVLYFFGPTRFYLGYVWTGELKPVNDLPWTEVEEVNVGREA